MEDWSKDILAALENTKIDDTLYDSAFFNNHKKYQHVYNFIGDMIVGNLNPKSVIDWGCGCGFLLERLYGHGITDILGIEGSSDVVPFWQSELASELLPKLVIADVTKPIDVGKYELAVCMEVAEHIPEEDAELFVEKVCDSSTRFVWWTAAQPGQMGTGHVNNQPLYYWVLLFAKFGFNPIWKKTYAMKQIMLQNHAICLAYPWYRDNLILFVNDNQKG